MKARLAFNRIDVVIGLIILAGAVLAAIMIHRALGDAWCVRGTLTSPPITPGLCKQPPDYPIALRIGIAAAGLVIAVIIASIRHILAARRLHHAPS
ncbi:MAG: hypothetical protein ACYCO9_07695 [Streptosporangiaceae bacterium]